jgi:hypothetical protein
MYSTFPTITKYTLAILEATCKEAGVTPETYRMGTLKRVGCELGNLLENALNEMHPDDRAALESLHQQVRCALADE